MEVIGNACRSTARLSAGGYLALAIQNGDKVFLNRDEARELAPILAHYADHGTLWQDPAPLKRVRCKVDWDGELREAEGYDLEWESGGLLLVARIDNGRPDHRILAKASVTDLEYID